MGDIFQQCVNNCLRLSVVEATCNRHRISTNTLFDGIDLHEFLGNEEYRAALDIDPVDVYSISAVDVLQRVCRHLRTQVATSQPINQGLVITAEAKFAENRDVFKAEIENEKMLQEMRLETLRFENVNKRQLDITLRNTYITLAGMIITALLTIVNIIVSIVIPKN